MGVRQWTTGARSITPGEVDPATSRLEHGDWKPHEGQTDPQLPEMRRQPRILGGEGSTGKMGRKEDSCPEGEGRESLCLQLTRAEPTPAGQRISRGEQAKGPAESWHLG